DGRLYGNWLYGDSRYKVSPRFQLLRKMILSFFNCRCIAPHRKNGRPVRFWHFFLYLLTASYTVHICTPPRLADRIFSSVYLDVLLLFDAYTVLCQHIQSDFFLHSITLLSTF